MSSRFDFRVSLFFFHSYFSFLSQVARFLSSVRTWQPLEVGHKERWQFEKKSSPLDHLGVSVVP